MTFAVSLDLAGALGGPERCPECHGGSLASTTSGGRVVFRCAQCRRCWAADHGVLTLVDPPECRAGGTGRPAGEDRLREA